MLASIRAFVWRVIHLARGSKSEPQFEKELAFHMQMEIEENLRQGMNHEEARRQALISLGGMEQTREACRETCAIRWAAEFRRDLGYGWRMMRKSPRFTAIAVLTLALGIGANSAIFSAVYGILLRPLPYRDSSRLVTIRREQVAIYVAYAELRAIRQQCSTLEHIATYELGRLPLGAAKAPTQVTAAHVSADFFPLVGTWPLLGRPILADDTQAGNDHVAVLSYRLWMDEFGGDPGIVGRDISVNQVPYSVLGVMPREFGAGIYLSYLAGKYDGSAVGMWVPQVPSPADASNGGYSIIIARLKKGATLAQLNAQLQPLSARFAASYPKAFVKRAGPELMNLSAKSLDLGIDPNVRAGLWILMGAVGFVLLMACVNVTSLLVARSWTRQRELAIRKALGASRPRILRQLMAESLLLALAGGALGLFLSLWGVRLLRALAPPNTPRVDLIRLNGSVLWFTMGISLLVAVLVGLAPAVQASSRRMGGALRGVLGDSFAGLAMRRPHRLRSALVILEVLLAVIVVAGGALMGRSFYRLMSTDIGLDSNHILTMKARFPDLECSGRDGATKCRMAARDMLHEIRSLPGVQRAALSLGGPFSGPYATFRYPGSGPVGLYVEGREGDQLPAGHVIIGGSVTQGYFATLGIRLRKGRDFEPGDEGAQAAIVSESFAHKYIAEDPLGKRFSVRMDRDGRHQWMEVVGVVNAVRNRALKESPMPEYYTPFAPEGNQWDIIVQTSGNPMPLVPAITRVIQAAGKDAPVTHIETLDQILADSSVEPRFQTALVGSFAVLGLILAIVGIYGVISYSVVQRTHEIGVRLALGAQRADVLRMILREGMRLAVSGIAIGTVGALALTRVLRGMLFEIEPNDPATIAGAAMFLTIAALAACYLPARRATRVDPMLALRNE
ncbi:MAG: ABC transporter permease [Acidobacteriia bacterium]|nr:ABC transporter permease [Terriglobia bacterium]